MPNAICACLSLLCALLMIAASPTYNALISACAKGDNAEKALKPWVEMQRKGLEPDVISYSALINACAKGDYVEMGLQFLAEM